MSKILTTPCVENFLIWFFKCDVKGVETSNTNDTNDTNNANDTNVSNDTNYTNDTKHIRLVGSAEWAEGVENHIQISSRNGWSAAMSLFFCYYWYLIKNQYLFYN